MAGITPPSTLSVVPGLHNESGLFSLALLDWNSTKFFDEGESAAQPSSDVLQIVTLAAQSMAVIPPAPPAANSSFHVQFYGPTLQCNTANSSQQSNFDYYTKALANSSLLAATKDLYKSGNLTWGENGPPGMNAPLMSVYSAFSPFAGQNGWLDGSNPSEDDDYAPDAYNNWIAEVPPISVSGVALPGWEPEQSPFATQQLWIQTSDKAIVCIMGNASFDVDFEFVDAALTVAEYSITNYEPFWMPFNGGYLFNYVRTDVFAPLPAASFWNPFKAYMAVYLALSSLLNGNVSTTLTSINNEDWYDRAYTDFNGNVTIYEGSSKILQYGLSACDELVHNFVSSPFSLEMPRFLEKLLAHGFNVDHAISIVPVFR